jgi:hypothetical protein
MSNQSMDALILRLAGRAPATPASPPLRERLSGALDELDTAKRAGDEDAIGFYEFRIEKLLDEARANANARARQPDHGGFDGGVRGTGTRPTPGTWPEPTSAQLMQQAMLRSREERAQREADEHTIFTT